MRARHETTRAARLIAAIAAATLALTAAPAGADPGVAEPVELLSGERLGNPRIWASGSGEAIATVTEGHPGDYSLLALNRSPGKASFGVERLAPALDAPPALGFDLRGAAFAVWGVGGKVDRAEVAFRPPGGSFTAAVERDACGARASIATGPAGELALLCRATVGPGPASYRVVLHAQPGVEAEDGVALNLDTGIESGEVEPRVAIGADGTLLAAWRRPAAEGSVLRAAVAAPGEMPGATVTLDAGVAAPSLDDVAVLPDGTALVLATYFDRVVLFVKRPGEAFEEEVLARPVFAQPLGHRLAVTANGTAIVSFSHRLPGGDLDPKYLVRSPGGSPGPVGELAPGGWEPGKLLLSADGTAFATLSLKRVGGGRTHAVTVRPPDGEFGPLTVLPGLQAPHFALSGGGDVLALWVEPGEAATRLLLGGLDSGAPPELAAVEVPATATAGEPVRVSARAFDSLALDEVRWSFGDGTAASGATSEHVYSAPGEYEVTVTASDRAGNERSERCTVLVTAAPPPGGDPLPGGPQADPAPPAADTRPPRLRLRAPRALPSGALRRAGIPLRVATDEPARIRVAVRRGRRTLTTRRLSPTATASRLRLRIAGRRLGKVGRARLRIVVTATDAAGNRARQARRLTVR